MLVTVATKRVKGAMIHYFSIFSKVSSHQLNSKTNGLVSHTQGMQIETISHPQDS